MSSTFAFWPTIEDKTGTESEVTGMPFLVFRLGEMRLGFPALAVREIHALPLLSPLPKAAPFVLGMFNLRGTIVPVVDLNARFGNESPPLHVDDALIVLEWEGAPLAILANEVLAVSHVLRSQIGAPPARATPVDVAEPFVAGVTQIDEEIVLLLHLPHLLDFSLHPAPSDVSTPHFEARIWPDAERETLQWRAWQLRIVSNGDDETTDHSFNHDASPDEKRAPVAVFALGGEEFATPLDLVREFTSITSVARVPCCPPHILGQINLRGDIVTLLDVRQTLRTARTTPPFFSSNETPTRAVSVVVVQHESEIVGIAVDEVRDVLYLRPDEWSALEGAQGSESEHPYFAGGATYQGRLLPLLDIGRLLTQAGLEVDETA